MSEALPHNTASSLKSDGSRNYVHPADVSGRFHNLRRVTFALLLAVLLLLPWVQVGGHPAVFFDFPRRQFFLFGATLNAQDAWLGFFLLSGMGYALFVVTTVWGRVWCGYVCPQTVFLEGLFRPIERFIEGPRNERMRRNGAPLSWDKVWRKTLKHVVYVALAFALAHAVLAYFVSLPRLYRMVLGDPAAHPEAFAWAAALTAAFYFIYSWFREQLCLIVCPYGRLQSVMTDRHTIVIGYDEARGEPRGKAGTPSAGDCVDCGRCVVVCPTGIDIRNGLQIDCVGCARCVDACDEVMVKLRRKPGLVRYDSLAGLRGQPRKLWRPRLTLYAALGVVGITVAGFAFGSKAPYEANLIRLPGAPHTVDGEQVRNGFQLHLVNKAGESRTFEVRGVAPAAARFTIAMQQLALPSLGSQHLPVFVSFPRGVVADGETVVIEVISDAGDRRRIEAKLSAPR